MNPGLNNFPALDISEAASRRDKHIKTFIVPINAISITYGGRMQDETASRFQSFLYFRFSEHNHMFVLSAVMYLSSLQMKW